jgi:MFS family permease
MGSFEVEPSQSKGASDAVEIEGDDREPSRPSPGGIEPTLIDIIGRSLIGRHFGAVYDPAPGGAELLTATAEPTEPVIDLRGPTSRPSRQLRARWRAFTTYWRGDLLSMIGDHFTLVALPLAADHLTGSGFKVGVVVSAEMIATVLFGTVAGTFADRRLPRPTMITCDLLRATVLAGLVVLDRAGHSNFAALVVAAFVIGALRLVSDGSRSAFVADLVPDELDKRSNNRLVLAENIGSTIGPVLAGVVIAGGLWRAFGIDALSFGCSAAAIALVGRIMRRSHISERTRSAPEEAETTSYRADSRDAIAAIRANVVFRRALVVMTVFNLAALPLGPQFVTLARHTLGMQPWLIGVIFAIGGVAGILSAPFVERDHVIRPGVIAIGTGTCGLGVLLVGITPSTTTVCIAFVVGGASFTFLFTHWAALRQRLFPVEQQGRVTLTARRLLFLSTFVGAMVGGWLSDAARPRALWLASGAAGIAVAIWGVAVGLLSVRYD